MSADYGRPVIPPKPSKTDYPVIDTDPHIKRVYSYARPWDWVRGTIIGFIPPAFIAITDRVQPPNVGSHNYMRAMRLAGAVGIFAGLIDIYQKSSHRFMGLIENGREEEMDMREMVDKVKKGEPLYGVSTLSPYMQGVAARNSRNNVFLASIILWPNFVNHNQHGVDTAKYYQQAERELEAERLQKDGPMKG